MSARQEWLPVRWEVGLKGEARLGLYRTETVA